MQKSTLVVPYTKETKTQCVFALTYLSFTVVSPMSAALTSIWQDFETNFWCLYSGNKLLFPECIFAGQASLHCQRCFCSLLQVIIASWTMSNFFASNTNIWASSSEFVSSSIPSWQILTAHAQPFRGARDLAFCLNVPLDSLLIWASSEGSGETERMHRR